MATLRLTSPLTRGEAVKVLQRKLAGDNAWKKNFRPGKIDGVFGPGTAGSVMRAKFYMGYPKNQCDGIAGTTFQKFLSGKAKLPASYAWRRKRRIAAAAAQAEKSKMRLAALKLARTQVGTTEKPAGSNVVKYSTWYGMIGPWCAMYCTWLYVAVGSKVFRKGSKWAYVPYLLHATYQAGSGVTRTADPQPGDLVLYDWQGDGEPDHIGVFIKWISKSGGTFQANEGNTSSTNASNGGNVEEPTRNKSSVRAFVKVHG